MIASQEHYADIATLSTRELNRSHSERMMIQKEPEIM